MCRPLSPFRIAFSLAGDLRYACAGRFGFDPAVLDERGNAELGDDPLAGAALDVLSVEPPPPGNPLFTARNCLITPHIGNTRAMAVPLLSERIATNCRLFAAGEPLIGLVDVTLGY